VQGRELVVLGSSVGEEEGEELGEPEEGPVLPLSVVVVVVALAWVVSPSVVVAPPGGLQAREGPERISEVSSAPRSCRCEGSGDDMGIAWCRDRC
jgi:hypothetical protein